MDNLHLVVCMGYVPNAVVFEVLPARTVVRAKGEPGITDDVMIGRAKVPAIVREAD